VSLERRESRIELSDMNLYKRGNIITSGWIDLCFIVNEESLTTYMGITSSGMDTEFFKVYKDDTIVNVDRTYTNIFVEEDDE
jgi:hypothetical protein